MKKTLISIISKIVSPKFWINLPKNTIVNSKKTAVVIVLFSSFFILLIIALISEVYHQIEKIPLLGIPFRKIEPVWEKTGGKYVNKLTNFLDKVRTFEVKRTYLIYLAFENLRVRKSRTFITIAGMSFGIGVIVLLLSLGYGIERLVINKVATLNELKVVDISAGGSTSVKLNKDALQKIKGFTKIDQIIPLVSIVGRISFNKSTTDVLLYSTTNDYFEYISSKLKDGHLFGKNKLSLNDSGQQVAGAETERIVAKFGNTITGNTVEYNIIPEDAAVIWSECSTDSQIIGYASHIEEGYKGQEYWGSSYYPFEGDGEAAYDNNREQALGKWVKGVVAVFDKNPDDSLRPSLDPRGVQKWIDGCVEKRYVQISNEYSLREVLGASTKASNLDESGEVLAASDSATPAFDAAVVGSDSAGIEMIDLQAQDNVKKKEVKALKFKKDSNHEAIVSTSLLNLLGIPESKALSTTFKAALIIGKSQISQLDGKAFSEEVEYKIVGVIDDDQNQYFYVPFSDVQNLGVTNYSQAKIVLADKNEMSKARKQIEVLGLRTTSTADTVAQIESLFGNLRLVLGLLGMVALAVASLGMFNTLTVSLLERTREIGGMKTIGMVTAEVQDLFLSEAMIMGLSGGIGGLILGFVIGKTISLLISIFSLTHGGGFIDLTYIPPFLIIFILVSSFIVGVITGVYPAMRAKKISALNALRYE